MPNVESHSLKMRPWLSAYPAHLDVELNFHRFGSVLELVSHAVRKRPDAVAFVSGERTMTFQQLLTEAQSFAAYLATGAGIRQGDRVAVMLPNLLEFPVCFLGILLAGAVQVSVNPHYTSRELQLPLADSGARLLIVHGKKPFDYQLQGTQVESLVVVGEADPALHLSLPAKSFAAALAEGAGVANWRAPELHREDTALLQYTGGTTGHPKGAELTHGNVVSSVLQVRAMLTGALKDDEETVLTVIPLYHIFALTVNFLTFLTFGAKNILLESPRDAQAVASAFLNNNVSIFAGVNTSYASLLAMPELHDFNFSGVKLAVAGGSAVQRAVSNAWHARSGRHILEGYGLSETTCVVTMNLYTNPAFTASVGVPFPATDVMLMDDAGARVGAGTEGEICVKGPQVMRGYWRNVEATHAAFNDQGYFKTGDIGTMDEQGFIRICDRKKDMVIVSGFKVFPNEVEGVLAELAGVAESAVTGVPDVKTGEAVKAFIVRKDASLTEAKVRDHCRTQLAGYKVPKAVAFVESLPKSPVGKILRRELREAASSTA